MDISLIYNILATQVNMLHGISMPFAFGKNACSLFAYLYRM